MKISSLWAVPVLLIVSGCASKGYVNRQIDPVACKVDILEGKAASLGERADSLENRLATLESQVSRAELANKAMLDEAKARAADSAQRAEAAAASATQAAERAGAAAATATQAAERADKAFELGQTK